MPETAGKEHFKMDRQVAADAQLNFTQTSGFRKKRPLLLLRDSFDWLSPFMRINHLFNLINLR